MSHPHPSENPSVPFPCPQNEMEDAAFLHLVPTYVSYLSPGVSSCPGRKWVEKAFLIYWMTKTEICFLLITQMLSISWPRSNPGRVRIEDLYQDAATCWIKDGTCCPNPRSPPVQFSFVTQLCPTLCDPMDCSMPDLPVYHQLTESTQTHVHWVSDAIQPSHPLLSPSSPALNLSQHQGLFKWVSSEN